jgi:hypothetical protein
MLALLALTMTVGMLMMAIMTNDNDGTNSFDDI